MRNYKEKDLVGKFIGILNHNRVSNILDGLATKSDIFLANLSSVNLPEAPLLFLLWRNILNYLASCANKYSYLISR